MMLALLNRFIDVRADPIECQSCLFQHRSADWAGGSKRQSQLNNLVEKRVGCPSAAMGTVTIGRFGGGRSKSLPDSSTGTLSTPSL
jgi:hypothetical protein